MVARQFVQPADDQLCERHLPRNATRAEDRRPEAWPITTWCITCCARWSSRSMGFEYLLGNKVHRYLVAGRVTVNSTDALIGLPWAASGSSSAGLGAGAGVGQWGVGGGVAGLSGAAVGRVSALCRGSAIYRCGCRCSWTGWPRPCKTNSNAVPTTAAAPGTASVEVIAERLHRRGKRPFAVPGRPTLMGVTRLVTVRVSMRLPSRDQGRCTQVRPGIATPAAVGDHAAHASTELVRSRTTWGVCGLFQ